MSDSRRGKRMETQLPHLLNPHIIKKTTRMKRRICIAVWVILAMLGALSTRSNIIYWLIGLMVGKAFIRLLLTVSLVLILFVITYLLIFGGLFWILIN